MKINTQKKFALILIILILAIVLTLFLEKKVLTEDKIKIIPKTQPIVSTNTEANGGKDQRNKIEKLLTREDGRGPIEVANQFGTSAVPILLEIIKPDYSPIIPQAKEARRLVRVGAIDALGFIGDKRAVNPLVSILKTKSEESIIRGSAAYALGRIGDPEALNPLIDALSDEDFSIREWAIKALVKMKDKRAIPALEELYKRETKEFIKKQALKAIEQIRNANR